MEIKRSGSAVTVTAGGRINANNAPEFASALERAVVGATDLTLDFSKLVYISSSGLRAVMLAAKAMRRQGTMRITGVDENVYQIFDQTGFTGVCDIETAQK